MQWFSCIQELYSMCGKTNILIVNGIWLTFRTSFNAKTLKKYFTRKYKTRLEIFPCDRFQFQVRQVRTPFKIVVEISIDTKHQQQDLIMCEKNIEFLVCWKEQKLSHLHLMCGMPDATFRPYIWLAWSLFFCLAAGKLISNTSSNTRSHTLNGWAKTVWKFASTHQIKCKRFCFN